MLETIKTFREAFDFLPSWAFILGSGLVGFVLFSVVGLMVDRIHQKGVHPPSAPATQVSNAHLSQELSQPKPSNSPAKKIEERIKAPIGNISQTSNAPYSPNIVTGDQGQVIINNPPPNPYGAVVTWDYNGARRSQSGGNIKVIVGDEIGAFQTLLRLESQSDWKSLLRSSEEQIKHSPTWPTPYLFAAEANAHLGNLPLAGQQLQAVERTVSNSPDYAPHIRKVRELLKASQF
jgi:hypothetical protein